MLVEHDPIGIRYVALSQEVIEVWVDPGQVIGASRVQLPPMRAAAMVDKDLFDSLKEFPCRFARIPVHRNVSALSSGCGPQLGTAS